MTEAVSVDGFSYFELCMHKAEVTVASANFGCWGKAADYAPFGIVF